MTDDYSLIQHLLEEANGSTSSEDLELHKAEMQRLCTMISESCTTAPQQWTKAELERWCLGWCRTPHTTLKAFIDAGFCSDQEPSREEMRLLRKPDTREGGGIHALANIRGESE